MNMPAHMSSPALAQRPVMLRSIDLDQAQAVPTPNSITSTPRQQCKNCALHKVCMPHSAADNSLDALSAMAKHLAPLQKGSHFYRQHDTLDSLYIVRSGAVKTYYINEQGEQHITGYYLPGEWFGIDGLVNKQHKYSAQALDTSAVCIIPYAKLEQGFQSHPDLQQRIMTILCAEIYDRQQPLLSLRQNPAEERLATFLTDISSRLTLRGLSATEFSLPMARRDIAAYLGVAEETMSRLFSRFQSKKLLSVNGRMIRINDLSALKLMSVTLN